MVLGGHSLKSGPETQDETRDPETREPEIWTLRPATLRLSTRDCGTWEPVTLGSWDTEP